MSPFSTLARARRNPRAHPVHTPRAHTHPSRPPRAPSCTPARTRSHERRGAGRARPGEGAARGGCLRPSCSRRPAGEAFRGGPAGWSQAGLDRAGLGGPEGARRDARHGPEGGRRRGGGLRGFGRRNRRVSRAGPGRAGPGRAGGRAGGRRSPARTAPARRWDLRALRRSRAQGPPLPDPQTGRGGARLPRAGRGAQPPGPGGPAQGGRAARLPAGQRVSVVPPGPSRPRTPRERRARTGPSHRCERLEMSALVPPSAGALLPGPGTPEAGLGAGRAGERESGGRLAPNPIELSEGGAPRCAAPRGFILCR